MFSLAENTSETLDEVVELRYPYFYHLMEQIEGLHVAYEEKKKDTNSMDFDDLLVKTLLLLKENKDICEIYQKQFEFVLVDEYQDTNQVQAEMIDLLGMPQKKCHGGW